MNLSQLYYFKKLSEIKHFNKAAKELYITQPTLSNSITKLEKELGVSLFSREQNGVSLTEDGVSFERHISVALSEIDRAVELMHGRGKESGLIRISTTDSIQRDYLPSYLSTFQQECKEPIRHEVSIANTLESIKELREGKADVAFCTALPLEDLESIPFMTQNLVAYVHIDHPMAQKGRITLKELELSGSSLVTYGKHTLVMNRLVGNALRKAGLSFVEKFSTEIDAATLIAIDPQLIGIALDTTEGILFPSVVRIPIEEFSQAFHLVSIVFKKSVPRSDRVFSFLSFSQNHSLLTSCETPLELAYWDSNDRKKCGL